MFTIKNFEGNINGLIDKMPYFTIIYNKRAKELHLYDNHKEIKIFNSLEEFLDYKYEYLKGE